MGENVSKTVVIWDKCEGELMYFVTEKNTSGLDGKYVNDASVSEEEEERILNLLSDSDETLMSNTFPVEEVRNGADVIAVGFIP